MALAEDNFTMKWNEQRIYMMNYERRVNELFSGEDTSFSKTQILLGIQNEEEISSVKSQNGRYIAFSVNGNLWCYDEKENSSRALYDKDTFYSINILGE